MSYVPPLNLTINPSYAIQTAIDTISARGGGKLFMLAGTYFPTDNINVPSGVSIVGNGSGNTIIDFGALAFQVQVVGTAMSSVTSVTLQGITLQNSTVDLLDVQYAQNLAINDLFASDGSANAITIDNSTIVNTNIVTIDSCDKGIVVTNSDSFTFQNNSISNCVSGGMEFSDFTNSVITDTAVDTCGVFGFKLTNVTNVGLQQITNINIDGVGYDIIGAGDTLAITEANAANCTGDGMSLTGVSGFVTYGVTFNDNGGYGVNIDVDSTDNIIGLSVFSANTSGAVNDLGTGTLIRSNIGVADN